jgi:hypothetical protein
MSGYVDMEGLWTSEGAIVSELGVTRDHASRVTGLGVKMSKISGRSWREQLT